MRIRMPRPDELPELSELCLRSKAVWGYDQDFIEACREELTLRAEELHTTHLAVADCGDCLVGVVQIGIARDQAELLKLFVEPDRIEKGIGRRLLNWAIEKARALGAVRLIIEADPGAAPFYSRMGAYHIGSAPSGSIPGRTLPKLAYDLQGEDGVVALVPKKVLT